MRKEQYNYIHHYKDLNPHNHYVPAAGDQHVALHGVHNPTIPLLPPGFRFHPTDEELVSFYLASKLRNPNFTDRAITEADLNKLEPWELPGLAKMGEKEWYFYSSRDRKYPTGMRTNRATAAGYWKATGKDREIFSSMSIDRGSRMPSNNTPMAGCNHNKTHGSPLLMHNSSSSDDASLRLDHIKLVGMKKTLVFYKGRAPRGSKSNWVMHEYRASHELVAEIIGSTSNHILLNHMMTAMNSHNPNDTKKCIVPTNTSSGSGANDSGQNRGGYVHEEWVICRVFHKSPGGKKTSLSELWKENMASMSCITSRTSPTNMSVNPNFDSCPKMGAHYTVTMNPTMLMDTPPTTTSITTSCCLSPSIPNLISFYTNLTESPDMQQLSAESIYPNNTTMPLLSSNYCLQPNLYSHFSPNQDDLS